MGVGVLVKRENKGQGMEKHDNVPQWRPLGCDCEEVEVLEGYGGGCSEKSR